MREKTTLKSVSSNWLTGYSLSPQAQGDLERFLREHLHHPALQLPSIVIYTGRLVSFAAQVFQFGAITFNRRIFVRPDLLFRDGDGRLMIRGALLAHETTHVCQYQEQGLAKFLLVYLQEYVAALWQSRKLTPAARMNAYLSISAEVAAREAERAYQLWKSTGPSSEINNPTSFKI